MGQQNMDNRTWFCCRLAILFVAVLQGTQERLRRLSKSNSAHISQFEDMQIIHA